MRPLRERVLSLLRRRLARPIVHGLGRPVLLRRMARASTASLLGLRFRTEPGVFHPVYFRSSRVLAEHLLARPLAGVRLLDMGTGSGPIAVLAASRGATVTACDLNPKAVALARRNAQENRVAVDVLESDLFAAIDGRVFDVIAFNIPFYPTVPSTDFEAAFRAGPELTTVRRFAEGAAAHLAPGGRVVIVFSEDCDRVAVLRHFAAAGFVLEDEQQTHLVFERFHVATFAPPA